MPPDSKVICVASDIPHRDTAFCYQPTGLTLVVPYDRCAWDSPFGTISVGRKNMTLNAQYPV